jgi:PAS domain S-box-containing protein
MESYIVRIYRRGKGRESEMAGTVEEVGGGLQNTFHTARELVEILSDSQKSQRDDLQPGTGKCLSIRIEWSGYAEQEPLTGIFLMRCCMTSPIKPTEATSADSTVLNDTPSLIEAKDASSGTTWMLEDIVQGMTESILLLSADRKILWANNAAVHQAGLKESDLIGRQCYQVSHGNCSPCKPLHNPCPVQELIRTGEPVAAVHEHQDKHGNTVYSEVSAYPIRDNAGTVVRIVHISSDITERMNLEKERETLILELQDALVQIKMLTGIIPICSSCKKIRNRSGDWEHIESYIRQHSEAEFSHGMCPHCVQKLYPDHA